MSVLVYGKSGVSADNRVIHDVYPTPEWAVEKAVKYLPQVASVVDAGSGQGIWGKHYKPGKMVGVELRNITLWDGYFSSYPNTDYLTWKPDFEPDMVLGNPPYHLFEDFFWRSWDVVLPSNRGVIAWILPLKYLQGDGRYERIFSLGHLSRVLTFVKRLDFTGKGAPHDQSALYIWDKEWRRDYYKGGWIP